MWRYIELLSFEPLTVIRKWRAEVDGGRNPRDIKVMFAKEIVARFHSAAAADAALTDFDSRFKQGEIPEDVPEHSISIGSEGISLAQAIKQVGLLSSTSDALRMIDQGGVRVNGEKVSDRAFALPRNEAFVVQVGKRKYAKITLK
jgi:tyrosyl-tRNA synthetase